jgi:hypothetical protein
MRKEVRKWGSSLFRVGELKEPASLIVKLRNAQDPLSHYLRDQFTPELKRQLEEYNGSAPPHPNRFKWG